MHAHRVVRYLRAIQRQIAAGRALARAGQHADADAAFADAEARADLTAGTIERGAQDARQDFAAREQRRAASSSSPSSPDSAAPGAGHTGDRNPSNP